MKFIFNWMMDQLGYMPKITIDVGSIATPLPEPEPKVKASPKKKPAVAAKTARAKKVK